MEKDNSATLTLIWQNKGTLAKLVQEQEEEQVGQRDTPFLQHSTLGKLTGYDVDWNQYVSVECIKLEHQYCLPASQYARYL